MGDSNVDDEEPLDVDGIAETVDDGDADNPDDGSVAGRAPPPLPARRRKRALVLGAVVVTAAVVAGLLVGQVLMGGDEPAAEQPMAADEAADPGEEARPAAVKLDPVLIRTDEEEEGAEPAP